MCYSKDWMANDERRQREAAKVKEAEGKALRNDQHYAHGSRKAGHAVPDSSKAREGAPAK